MRVAHLVWEGNRGIGSSGVREFGGSGVREFGGFERKRRSAGVREAWHTHDMGQEARWAALIARDRNADGTFYYSVKTTGVYCRPSCAARRPNRKNVAFHATRAAAEQAGFRPCRRCRPDLESARPSHAATIATICRLIESVHTMPSLSSLAKRAGLSPYHFHRTFKAITGVTPRAYAAAHRSTRVRAELQKRSKTVTEAIYDAGFSSGGRFYEASNELLGMTPSEYRAGGASTRIHFAVGECSLGSVLVAQSARGVCAILLGDDPDALVRDVQDRFPQATFVGDDPAFARVVATVVGFVEAPAQQVLDLPLDIRGTAFQQRVWQALRQIPVGSTASYSDIAKRIGAPQAVRAVARACGANPLAVAIPCHRVVRTDGSQSGYRWGVERKRALLTREGAA
jgi:AraC family transcriptional regulator, regulatory protein of adaptative response / methylated-DNA-[protein]-cysteine methyltransferase